MTPSIISYNSSGDMQLTIESCLIQSTCSWVTESEVEEQR